MRLRVEGLAFRVQRAVVARPRSAARRLSLDGVGAHGAGVTLDLAHDELLVRLVEEVGAALRVNPTATAADSERARDVLAVDNVPAVAQATVSAHDKNGILPLPQLLRSQVQRGLGDVR